MKWMQKIYEMLIPKYGIYLGYILVALLVGENQPFTRVPMYDNLPNWAYVFYIKDNNDNPIYLKTKKTDILTTESLSHMFSSYCNKEGFYYGYGKESDSTLELSGRFLMGEIYKKWPKSIVKPLKVYLVRKHLYFTKDGQLVERDKQIAESHGDF
jgi:hypothetical protein